MKRWATLASALLFAAIAPLHQHRLRPKRRRLDHAVRRQEPRPMGERRHRHLRDRRRLGHRQGQEGPQSRRVLSGHQAVVQGLRDPRRVLGERRRQQRHLHPQHRSKEDQQQDRLRGQHLRPAPRSDLRHRRASCRSPRRSTRSKAGGKWNTYEITAKGPKFWPSCRTARRPSTAQRLRHKEGPIALQFGVGTVKFRKVQIKPL